MRKIRDCPGPRYPFSSTTNGCSKFRLDDQQLLELRKAIGLLFMLTEIPPQLAENSIPASIADKARAPARRALTLAEEERLAGVFVFLASTSNDPRKVAALCLEESPDNGALTIKLAANHGDLTDTKLRFEDIARILRAAHEGGSFFNASAMTKGPSSAAHIIYRITTRFVGSSFGNNHIHEPESYSLSSSVQSCKVAVQL
jgi:hypothetical protein